MRILATILLTVGLFVCAVSNLGIRYELYVLLDAMMSPETTGIGAIASAMSTASLLSYGNLLGCAVIFLGVLLNIVGLFTGKKQQQQVI